MSAARPRGRDDARAAVRRRVRRDLRWIAGAAALFLGAALFEPYDTSRPSTEDPTAAVRDNVALADRLGYAVLLRAGYAEIVRAEPPPAGAPDEEAAFVAGDDEPNRPPLLTVREWHPDFACVGGGEHRAGVDAQLLTVALAAIEAYNRRPARQRVESALAAATLKVSGGLPDYSLGPMQIRPSTARAVLHEELDGAELPGDELHALLEHRCHSFRLAGRIVRGYIEEAAAATPDAVLADVARRYSGARSIDGRHYWYFEAVRGAYRLLFAARYPYGTMDDDPPVGGAGEEPAPPDVLPYCLYYRLGSVAPDDWPWLPPDSAGLARVTMVPLGVEPGPPVYAARVRERRVARAAAWLAQSGFDAARIAVGTEPHPATAAACMPQPNEPVMLLEVRGIVVEPGY